MKPNNSIALCACVLNVLKLFGYKRDPACNYLESAACLPTQSGTHASESCYSENSEVSNLVFNFCLHPFMTKLANVLFGAKD